MFTLKDRERCQQLYERYYAGRKFYDAIYRELIQRYLPRGGRLLDAGCGRYLKYSKEFAHAADVVEGESEIKLEQATGKTEKQGGDQGVEHSP